MPDWRLQMSSPHCTFFSRISEVSTNLQKTSCSAECQTQEPTHREIQGPEAGSSKLPETLVLHKKAHERQKHVHRDTQFTLQEILMIDVHIKSYPLCDLHASFPVRSSTFVLLEEISKSLLPKPKKGLTHFLPDTPGTGMLLFRKTEMN